MINKVQLIGRLGADPDMRYMPDGAPIANLRLATDESFKNQKGEKIERTEWHRVTCFSKLAEVAGDYMKKGRLVFVEGKLRTRKWTDQNNIDRYTTEIVASQLRMLDRATQVEATPHEAEGEVVPEDDVPF